ncbi:LPS-assembly protein LptD [Bartonella sp. CB178]|uniref:LPS-assembly protein LptD n=1 Tax=Bartonella sp. CB178 TaxID=3112255 RepID=UPI00300DC3F2
MKLQKNKKAIKKLRASTLKGIAVLLSGFSSSRYVLAQNPIHEPSPPLLLSADELIYNRDANTVSARGNVQIEYDGNKIVAKEVTYNQKTGRIIAHDDVEIIQKNGNKIRSSHINMTKDFDEGSVNSLYIDTVSNIHFAATNATRSRNQIMIFNNAAYTACEPCSYKKNRDVLWKIKARKIIWNSAIKKIQFENSRFEIFGTPIINLPTFELYDPTVRRASGILMPRFFYNDHLGMGIKNSYFWNLAPHYDFTLSSTVYTKQGLLTEGEWRQNFETGNYNIRFAHIYQIKPHHFDNDMIDAQQKNRYMLATKGDFRINSRWVYGWDVLTQSDKDFSRTYKLENYNNRVQLSQLYLSGLADKNYFDMRFYNFKVQDIESNNANNRNPSQQAWVLPHINYSFTPDRSVYTGLLTFHSNMQLIYRPHADFDPIVRNDNPINNGTQFSTISGNNFRLTNELEWKKRFATHSGLIFTPMLAFRTDIIAKNACKNHDSYIMSGYSPNICNSTIRGMATAGLELRYPLLITSRNSSHIIEPKLQFFLRNNEQHIGRVPNEDAQSFIFDATTLFQRNKFSGYDRVEGGVRANIGLRYSGNFNNNWSFDALIGQSLHLTGKNSFAEKNLVNVGTHSGLETRLSDYVATFSANNKSGFSLESRGRFDKKTGKIRRNEIEASKKWHNFWAAVQYAYIPSRPNYGYTKKRQEISFETGIKLASYWSINSNAGYDLESSTFTKRGISLNYTDECFGLTFSYQQMNNLGGKKPLQNFNFSLSLRTISDIGKRIN